MEPPTEEELASCPFCAGREDQTPPELFAVAPPGREPDTPGWTVRVVPNKYPAFEHHEVVIHSPRHVRSIADLSEAELAAVAKAWHERAAEALASDFAHPQSMGTGFAPALSLGGGFAHPQFVINEGRAAGASLPHSHSQVVWLHDPPPLVQREAERLHQAPCMLCELVARERADGQRLVATRGVLVAVAPWASRSPYEFWVAGEHWGGPLGHAGAYAPELADDVFLADALALAAETVGRLRDLEGPVPLNVWLHNSGHWHLEVVPRFSIHAGFELGAGIYLNSLAPEEAAARLRGD